ncbi:hypothetical protein H2202_002659 [Exophiala xenobiotica]|nr:hypothetical protein H2202_002659 [Exophiala xenobiotica]
MRITPFLVLASSLAVATAQDCSDPNGTGKSCYSQACGSGYTESLLGTISSQSSQFCGAGAAPAATTTTGGTGGAATSGPSSPSVTAAASTTAGGAGGPSSSTSAGLAVHNVAQAPAPAGAGAVVLGLFAAFL